MKKNSNSKQLIFPLGFLWACLALGASTLPQTSTGPTSSDEAQILWNAGQFARADRPSSQSIYSLERIVARYPAHPHAYEAKVLLAHAYLKTDQPQRAHPLLKALIQWNSASPESYALRADLAEAQLGMHHPSEALLLCDEILAQSQTALVDSPTHTRALISKSRALMELHQLDRAEKSLAAVVGEEQILPNLRGELNLARLDLKLMQCAELASARQLTEAQARDQFQRRTVCFLEALPLAKPLLTGSDLILADEGHRSLQRALIQQKRAALSPSRPPTKGEPKRSAPQLKSYLRELTAAHLADHSKSAEATQRFLQQNCPTLPACHQLEQALKHDHL